MNEKGEPTGGVSYEKHLSYQDYYCPEIEGFPEDFLGGDACQESRSWTAISKASPAFSLVPRSVESMVRFLGEVVRQQWTDSAGKSPWIPEIYARSPYQTGLQPLFLVARGKDAAAAVSVSDNGEHYAIPKTAHGMSMIALALLSEFFGLHQSATNLPTTPTVSVIGR